MNLNPFSWFKGKKQERGYFDLTGQGGMNGDWSLFTRGEDADIWQNIFTLRARMRDLWKTNPYFSKYRELIAANVFGEQGIMLRMKIKETEDRVIFTPDEKNALIAYERRRDKVRLWAQRKSGRRLEKFRAFDERKAMIRVGDPDVFANMMIERKWKEWQRAEYCDSRGRRDYAALRQLRLWSAARDGDHFIRLVRDPRANKFGFTLQHINAEWCDYFLNVTLNNGNEIRMGIEYETKPWGIGRPVAYHFIKRMPKDWQFSVAGNSTFVVGRMHDRIPANEIIHYARFTDADSTRPAPWGASTIVKSRGLDQFELAEVFAARAAACKTGWAYSDMAPEGGSAMGNPDPASAVRNLRVEPGGLYGLPWGVKVQEVNPTHPNQNFENFRKGMLRSWCAGMPGADYNTIANDLEGINFSAGRLGRLDTNEMSMLIQEFDISTAERPIFEAWLEMSLITGAIPLPVAKLEKFNQPRFQGRRWHQVDEVKEAQAAALRIANKLSSRNREAAEDGLDWEDLVFELAEEEMLLESLGMTSATTADTPLPPEKEDPEEPEDEDEPEPAKPATNGNGKAHAIPRITFQETTGN